MLVQRVQPLAITDNLLQQFVLASKKMLVDMFSLLQRFRCHLSYLPLAGNADSNPPSLPWAPQRKMCYVNALCYHTKVNAPSSVTHSLLQSKTILKGKTAYLQKRRKIQLHWQYRLLDSTIRSQQTVSNLFEVQRENKYSQLETTNELPSTHLHWINYFREKKGLKFKNVWLRNKYKTM